MNSGWLWMSVGIVLWGYCAIKYPPGERLTPRRLNLYADICFYFLFKIALSSVISSAYSMSPPVESPRARRVIFTPLFFNVLAV